MSLSSTLAEVPRVARCPRRPRPPALARALLVAAAAASAGAVSPRAGAPDAAAILRAAEDVRSPKRDYAVEFELVVNDTATSWKSRSARYAMIAHGKDHSLVLMHEPEQFYAGTLLIAEGNYWLLLPRADQPFQLAPRHVLNGDISNGDLARGNLVDDYTPRLLGEETVEGEPCWRLELTRVDPRAMYTRILAWITQRGSRPWRFEYFGETGSALKVADYRDYRKTPLGTRSMRIDVQNRQRPSERTAMIFSNLRPFDTSAFRFTTEALPAFRDAALAQRASAGTYATPEDLAARLRAHAP